MRAIIISLSLVLMTTIPAAAQTGQVGTPSAAVEGGGAVEVGAGTTSHVTTGSSGPSSASSDEERPQPIAVDMPFPPQGEGLLAYPGRLEIVPPRTLHCDIITDENARRLCAQGGLPGSEAAVVDNIRTSGGAISTDGENGASGEQSSEGEEAADPPVTAPTPLGLGSQEREQQ